MIHPVDLSRRRRGLLLGGASACCVIAWPARATEPPDAARLQGPVAGGDAKAWLQRLGRAAAQGNYTGTMVAMSGAGVSTQRVTRYTVGTQRYETSESLDGQPRIVHRHNDVVHTLWPQRKLAIVEQRSAPTPAAGPEALAAYDVKLDRVDRVAGHLAQALMLVPHDRFRHAQRIWAEQGSGLMLRAEILDPQGQVLESTAFTDLRLAVKPQPEPIVQAMQKLDAGKLEGWRIVRAETTRTRLEQEGWRLAVPVAGFQLISCVARPVDGGAARSGAPQIVQTIYSDGLVHVSVFIEPHRPERHQAMAMSRGATNAWSQVRDGWFVTVLGDVPAETIKAFAQALERVR